MVRGFGPRCKTSDDSLPLKFSPALQKDNFCGFESHSKDQTCSLVAAGRFFKALVMALCDVSDSAAACFDREGSGGV